MQQPDTSKGDAKLAEAALRNLHMDCRCGDPDGRAFTARMVAWQEGVLLATAPVAHGRPVALEAGQAVVCSCKLGQEVLRFSARVAQRCQAAESDAGTPPLQLAELTPPEVVQRRRYYRIPLTGRQPSAVTCWLVEPARRDAGAGSPAEDAAPSGPRVFCKRDGRVMDLSGGGIGIVIDDPRFAADAQGRQVWVRFGMPAENESLIFRAAVRHVQEHPGGGCRIGLEFVEYIEPGQHQAVIERLGRFTESQSA